MPAPDPMSLRRAARAVAAAMVVDDVARKALRALLELTGAQRGVLVLGEDLGAPAAVAEGSREGRLAVTRAPLPDDAPVTLIRHVMATRSVIHDGVDPSSFRADPARFGAWLALPICAGEPQGTVGAAVLEHDTAGTFGPAERDAAELIACLAGAAFTSAQAYDALVLRLDEKAQRLAELDARHRDVEERMVAQERLASLGTIVSGIAHEIKNPLNFVNNFAELSIGLIADVAAELDEQRPRLTADGVARLDEAVTDLAQSVAKIHEHGRRADAIVKGMLHHARGRAGEVADVEVNALVREYATSAGQVHAGPPAPRIGVSLRLDPRAGKARLVPEEVGRVVLNLVGNALDAARARRVAAGDDFTPEVSVSTHGLDERVEVRVRDNGGGIPEAIRDRIYQPFFTTKPRGEGTGLGLPLSREIIDRHGGAIDFETHEGGHTEFVVVLPRRPPA